MSDAFKAAVRNDHEKTDMLLKEFEMILHRKSAHQFTNFFVAHGFTLGATFHRGEIETMVLTETLKGNTSMKIFRAFFGGPDSRFILNEEAKRCLWDVLLDIDRKFCLSEIYNCRFLLWFKRMRTVVDHLAVHCRMPVKDIRIGYSVHRDGIPLMEAAIDMHCHNALLLLGKYTVEPPQHFLTEEQATVLVTRTRDSTRMLNMTRIVIVPELPDATLLLAISPLKLSNLLRSTLITEARARVANYRGMQIKLATWKCDTKKKRDANTGVEVFKIQEIARMILTAAFDSPLLDTF
jgi:hypothetical protein